MAIALVTQHRDASTRKRRLIVFGTLSGNYVQGTPIVIDWTTVQNPKLVPAGKPAANPAYAEVLNAPAGYTARLIKGTTMKNWGLTIYSTAGTELASGAFPAALIAQPFEFQLEGPKGSF